MPNLVPIQESFAAGELSPRLGSRVSTKGYKEGVRLLENMIPLAQGPAQRRSGFSFTFETPEPTPSARIIIFPVANDDYYVFLFTDLKLYILSKSGTLVAPELVLNTQFAAGSANWTPVTGGGSTAVFTTQTCTLTASGAQTASIRQNVTGLTIGRAYRLRTIQLSPLDSLRLRVGTTSGGAEVGQLTQTASVSTFVFTATAVSHWIEVTSLTPFANAVLDSVSVQEDVVAVPIVSPYSADVLSVLQYDLSPDGLRMYVCSGLYPVKQILYNGDGTFTITDAAFTSPPSSWTGTNHPRCITFFQGRLFFAGTAAAPSTFWGSKSGDYLNFTLGTLADDAIAYTIAKRGSIRWILGAKNLLIGTEFGEFVVSAPAGSQEIITPDSINIEPQSFYGSSPLQPIQIGNLVLYVSGDGRKLYSMGYRFDESGWISADLAFTAEHVPVNRIVRQAYAANPESILWFVDSQGQLVGCSYDRPNNIVGWHRHPTKSIVFSSVASVKFFGTDITWASWRVIRAGVAYTQLGALVLSPASHFLDAGKTVVSPTLTTSFSGFKHLAGLTVSVIADGATHPDVVVSSAGVVSLQRTALEVAAGFSSLARLKSLPFEPGVSPQGSQSSNFRFNKVYVQLVAASLPIINGKRGAERHPSTPMNTAEPRRTGKFFAVDLGYQDVAEITVEEPLPLPLTISGIFGDLAVESA
jgi:hypothetical protein